YCQSEAASLAWSDRYVGGSARPAGILFMLLADEIERSAETGGVAGGEKMFGRCRAGLAGTAHCFRHRQVRAHPAGARLGVAVATSRRRRGSGKERLDGVHEILQRQAARRADETEKKSVGGVALPGPAFLQEHLAEMRHGMGKHRGLILFGHEIEDGV